MVPLSRHQREKLQIEQIITDSAEKLFLECGYEQTTMDTLAQACEYTKRTIYRYFSCKEDLYFAVLLKGNKRMKAALFNEDMDVPTPGTLRRFIFRYRDFFFENEAFFDLMFQIKAVRMKKEVAELPYYKKYAQFAAGFHSDCIQLYEKTICQPEKRTKQGALALIFLLQGFFGILVQTGDRFTDFFDLNKIDFTNEALELLLSSLQ